MPKICPLPVVLAGGFFMLKMFHGSEKNALFATFKANRDTNENRKSGNFVKHATALIFF